MKQIELANAPGVFALVDDADFERVSQWRWLLVKHNSSDDLEYVARFENKKMILLHRVILDTVGDLNVDHRNRNGLDNQRHNLRPCTHTQNMRNRKKHKHGLSRFKGVWLRRRDNSWVAQIRVNRKKITICGFKDEEEAAKAYDSLAIRHFGEFARVNFPVLSIA